MRTTTYRPILVSPKTAVLLVFMPGNAAQRLAVELQLERVGTVLGNELRITLVDDATHPEVVNSFSINALPAFVLLKQGTEVWRQLGLLETPELIRSLSGQLNNLQPNL
ncbi:YbbN family protein [Tellurirhabdus rosea]|uniref:thioredoxin n=1 Tax=Tellurirhabdus rosea TaxID=2674997 RepID=UPI00225A9457|nr:thioredoxin [Tellurirhabdus rosea]